LLGNVRYTGYLDQVENCVTGALEWAWMLSHVCDSIDHAPGFPRAGLFHPDRSYTFVGPSAGFVVTPLLPSEPGAGPFEAVRRAAQIPGTVGLTCEYEEPINHVLNPVNDFCLCQIPTSTPQWFQGDLGVFGSCGTAVTTTGGPFLPGYLSMAIGFWTIPGTYPGQEQLRWNAGGYDWSDPCTGAVQQEVFFGVTTMQGYPATQLLSTGPAGPLPPIFIDQCNSVVPGGVTVMNIPFRPSDHFLNLNHP
jgi:hypothetical protein